jgi:Cdc6-like AAA superfamily ATPase
MMVKRVSRERRAAIEKVFTPTRPISTWSLFAGRYGQVVKVRAAIRQPGQHVIIYGERGVGKTSLSNVLKELLLGPNRQVVRINCPAGVTFSQLWRDAFQYIPCDTTQGSGGFLSSTKIAKRGTLRDQLPDAITPETIRYVLEGYSAEVVVMLDELDRIKNPETISGIADTIKTLSDHDVPATIVLIGVADSVEQLVAEHHSIQRALVQVLMPRMSHMELLQALEKGLRSLEMTIEPAARNIIVALAQGLPHYVHLLAKHAALAAVTTGSHISMAHLQKALSAALEDAQETIQSEYIRAIRSNQENNFSQVLLACALAEDDELGYFTPSAVRDPMSRVSDRGYEIAAISRTLTGFCDEKRGAILQKTGAQRQFRYRFTNPLMEPYIIMRGLKDGLITESALAEIELRDDSPAQLISVEDLFDPEENDEEEDDEETGTE